MTLHARSGLPNDRSVETAISASGALSGRRQTSSVEWTALAGRNVSALVRAIGKPDRSNAKRSEKDGSHDSAGEPELKPLWRLCQGDGYWAFCPEPENSGLLATNIGVQTCNDAGEEERGIEEERAT